MLLSRVADCALLDQPLPRAGRAHGRALSTSASTSGSIDASDRRSWDFSGCTPALQIASRPPATPPSPAALVDALVFDPANRSSVIACVTAARENARQVREEISSEMWEQLNALYLRLQAGAADGDAVGAAALRVARWSSKACICSRASRTRRWATAKAGSILQARPVPRARERDGGAARSALRATRRSAAAGREPRRMGRPAALVLGARSLLPLLHRRPPARADRRVPAAQRRVPAIGAVRGGARRVGAARDRAATARGAGGRAERLAGRLHASLDYGQVDEILDDDPHAYPRRHRPPLRADSRGALSELHRVSDRIGAAGMTWTDAMHYTIRHVTPFTYESPISESVMEARMQPRTRRRASAACTSG